MDRAMSIRYRLDSAANSCTRSEFPRKALSMTVDFEILNSGGESRAARVHLSNLVIAGWAGRDRAAIDEHIHELQEIGVTPPSTVPLFYRAAVDNLVTTSAIQALGPDTSGEAEPVLIQAGDEILVGVGSDHTDRKLETYSIAASKQICLKPVSRQVWRLSDVVDHWDDMVLRAWATIDGQRLLYQEGTLDGLLHPRDLFAKYNSGSDRLARETAMFGGTISVIDGIRPAARFEAELHDPKLGRSLRIAYDIETLPVVV